jgi:hypothetical protein
MHVVTEKMSNAALSRIQRRQLAAWPVLFQPVITRSHGEQLNRMMIIGLTLDSTGYCSMDQTNDSLTMTTI